MTIKGKLIGFSCLISKKGTDCLFAWIIQEFDSRDKGNLGSKAVQLQAFGDDCYSVKEEISKKQLLNKKVSCLGNWSKNSFSVLQISEDN